MIDQATADTLNKALDLVKQGVVAGIETVKAYAPMAWAMARRQVLLEGWQVVFSWVILALVYSVGMRCLYRRILPEKSEVLFDRSDRRATVIVFTTIFTIVTLILGINAIDLLGNPDYWTIVKIIRMTKGDY